MLAIRGMKYEQLIPIALSGSAHFTVANFTCDGNWHNLNISSFVPVKALSCLISGYILGNATNKWIQFNAYCDTGNMPRIGAQTEMANGTHYFAGRLPLDSTRTIQYRVTDTNVTIINLVINGYTMLK